MIDIQELSKRFGRLTALDKVSVRMESGECIALIGSNGCGKTTLMKSILGMVKPDSGSICINGKPTDVNGDYRKHIGYMPQIGRYPDNMTIRQVLEMMKDLRKGEQVQTDEQLVAELGLDENVLDKRMYALSGGTRQKVSAVLAFLFRAPILMLDEPTAGLDPLSAEILKLKIKQEHQKDKLVLITSHILSDLDELITHLIYMQDGRMLFKHSLDELKAQTGERELTKAIAYLMKHKLYAKNTQICAN